MRFRNLMRLSFPERRKDSVTKVIMHCHNYHTIGDRFHNGAVCFAFSHELNFRLLYQKKIWRTVFDWSDSDFEFVFAAFTLSWPSFFLSKGHAYQEIRHFLQLLHIHTFKPFATLLTLRSGEALKLCPSRPITACFNSSTFTGT